MLGIFPTILRMRDLHVTNWARRGVPCNDSFKDTRSHHHGAVLEYLHQPERFPVRTGRHTLTPASAPGDHFPSASLQVSLTIISDRWN